MTRRDFYLLVLLALAPWLYIWCDIRYTQQDQALLDAIYDSAVNSQNRLEELESTPWFEPEPYQEWDL